VGISGFGGSHRSKSIGVRRIGLNVAPVVAVGSNAVAERGAATQAVLMSVYRTLKLRGLNPTQTIPDALKTYLTTDKLPPLPQDCIANNCRLTG